jgi:hypothetical protein
MNTPISRAGSVRNLVQIALLILAIGLGLFGLLVLGMIGLSVFLL